MDPTPENAPCWQVQYRPREIWVAAGLKKKLLVKQQSSK